MFAAIGVLLYQPDQRKAYISRKKWILNSFAFVSHGQTYH